MESEGNGRKRSETVPVRPCPLLAGTQVTNIPPPCIVLRSPMQSHGSIHMSPTTTNKTHKHTFHHHHHHHHQSSFHIIIARHRSASGHYSTAWGFGSALCLISSCLISFRRPSTCYAQCPHLKCFGSSHVRIWAIIQEPERECIIQPA